MLAWDPQLSCGTRNDPCVLSSVCSNNDKCSNREKEKYIYYISFTVVFLNLDSSFYSPVPHGLNYSMESPLPPVICRLCSSLTCWLSTVTSDLPLGLCFLCSSFSASSSPSTFLSAWFPCLLLALLLHLFTSSVCHTPLQFSLPSPWVFPVTPCAFNLSPKDGWTMGMGRGLHNLLVMQMPVRVSASAPRKADGVTGDGGDLCEQILRGQLNEICSHVVTEHCKHCKLWEHLLNPR